MIKKKKSRMMTLEESKQVVGPNLSFAAAEAYKLLRTNLAFSLPEDKKCKVIGITSALAGEGKSTAALNLAYTVAQEGSRVLLMEADLRLPNMAKRLGIHSKPGLSNLLAGQCSGNDALQRCALSKDVFVMTAGDIPPNPAELLNSEYMHQAITALSEVFDAIIVDLPPVNVVTDALLASKFVDGIVVVVRQQYCEKKALSELIRQMKFANAKVLGFVVTDADTQKKSYKHGKSNYYYKTGGAESYAKSAKNAAAPQKK